MLKKMFLSIMAIVTFAVSVNAQNIKIVPEGVEPPPLILRPYTLSLGPKMGVNYAIAGDPDGIDLGLSGSMGFSAGLAANLRFARPAEKPYGTERFGIQLELLYAQRRLSSDTDPVKMNCYEIPLLLQWYVLPSLAIELGPTFTGASVSSPDELKYNNAVYCVGKIKASDVMLSFGLNCKTKRGFTANLRYNLGNSNIAGNFQTKVSTLSLSVGWLFFVIK